MGLSVTSCDLCLNWDNKETGGGTTVYSSYNKRQQAQGALLSGNLYHARTHRTPRAWLVRLVWARHAVLWPGSAGRLDRRRLGRGSVGLFRGHEFNHSIQIIKCVKQPAAPPTHTNPVSVHKCVCARLISVLILTLSSPCQILRYNYWYENTNNTITV